MTLARDPFLTPRTALIVGLLALGGTGCGDDDAPAKLVNAARFTVHSDPPVRYTLGQWSIVDKTDPQNPLLKWTQAPPELAYLTTQIQLRQGTHNAEFIRFSYAAFPGPTGDDLQRPAAYCSGDCQGTYTVGVDTVQRKLLIDIDLSIAAAVASCATRYSVRYPRSDADTDVVYTPCTSPACSCQQSLPCSGSVVQLNTPLCPDPSYRTEKLTLSLTANAELTEDMF